MQGDGGKEPALNALGDDHHEIGGVGEHHEGEKGLSQRHPDGEKVENGVQQGADGADDIGFSAGKERRPYAEGKLCDRQDTGQSADDADGKAQVLAERIDRQYEKGQKVEQGVKADFRKPVKGRHQASPPFRRFSKQKEA